MIKISQFICSFTFNKHVFNVVSFKKLATEHFIKNNKTKLNILLFLDDIQSINSVKAQNFKNWLYMKEYKKNKTLIHVIKN